jgi:hypothetical protein
MRLPSNIIMPERGDDEASMEGSMVDHMAAANYVEYEFLVTGINALDEWKTVLSRNPQ